MFNIPIVSPFYIPSNTFFKIVHSQIASPYINDRDFPHHLGTSKIWVFNMKGGWD